MKEPTLSHRTYVTTKPIPTLKELIDNQNVVKIRDMSQEVDTSVFRDGWTVVDHHPIVNVIMVSVLYTLHVLPLTLWDRRIHHTTVGENDGIHPVVHQGDR